MKLLARISLLLVSCLLCLLGLEGALWLMGFQPLRAGGSRDAPADTDAPTHPACAFRDFADAQAAGVVGLRDHPRFGYVYGRTRHGFADAADDAMDPSPGARRIRVLGDSFTAGAGAREGGGFVARLQAEAWSEPVRIYNAGVGGYGQNNQLAVLQTLMPRLGPQLVVVALYTGNDLIDNLTPVDRYTAFGGKWIARYEVISSGGRLTVTPRSQDAALRLYQRELGCRVRDPADLTRDLMTLSRVGTQLWLAARAVQANLSPRPEVGRGMQPHRTLREAGVEATRRHLSAMLKLTRASGTPLVAFVIPDRHASSAELLQSAQHQAALRLLGELGIPHLDPFEVLTIEDYWTGGNDHWNDRGHEKGFEFLRRCLTDRFEPIHGPDCFQP